MELKSLPFAVKSIEGRTVTGITAVMGNIDSGDDRIWPGAFTKTISERIRKVRHLWNHDADNPPIAAINELKEIGLDELPEQVLAMAPDARGALQITRTYLETPRGNEVLVGLQAGAINEMSFAFDPIPGKLSFTKEGDRNIRELYELRLWDTSDVNWGMNEATAAIKGLSLGMPLEYLLNQMEHQLKAGARHSTADVKLLNAIHKAAVSLGATDCKGIVDEEDEEDTEDEKSRAAIALTLKRAEDFLLEARISDFLLTR